MSSTALDKPSILIVDDSKLMRAALNKMLRDDYDVHEAGDGQEAWRLLSNGCPAQLVFTDLSMPVMDGFGLIKEIRGSSDDRIKELPIVVITGAEEDDKVREEALGMGATEFVTKPFKSTQIKARAQNLVGSRKAIEEVKQSAEEQLKAVELEAEQRIKEVQVQAAESIRAVEEKVEARVQQAEKEAVQQVFQDPHTHLSSPAYFEQRGSEEVSAAVRHQADLALLCIRVQHFPRLAEKAQNATASLIGAELIQSKRQEDCATWGDDGIFFLLMPKTPLDGAYQLSDRIMKALETNEELNSHWFSGQRIFCGLTILTPRSEQSITYLMATAEQCSKFAEQCEEGQVMISSEAEEYTKAISAEQELAKAEAEEKAKAKRDAQIAADEQARQAEEQERLRAAEQERAQVEARERLKAEQERFRRETEAKQQQQEEAARQEAEAKMREEAALAAKAEEPLELTVEIEHPVVNEEPKPFAGSVEIPARVEEKEKEDIERLRQTFREEQQRIDMEKLPAYSLPMKVVVGLALPLLILVNKISGGDPEKIEQIKSRLGK